MAGIVVVEQAKASGIQISFMDYAKAGFPVAVVCIFLSAFWIYFI